MSEQKKGIFFEIQDGEKVELTLHGERAELMAVLVGALADKENRFRELVDDSIEFMKEKGLY